MSAHTEQRTHHFPDGSIIEWRVATTDRATYDVVTADLARRMRDAVTRVPVAESDASPAGYGRFPPAGAGVDESTTTHRLPGGELTVHIDASGERVHRYLDSLVSGAVAYADVLAVDLARAGLLAAVSGACGLSLVAAGAVVPALPAFGVTAVVSLYVLLSLLAIHADVCLHW